MFAPSAPVLSGFYWVFDGQPAWSLDFLLQNEQLEHGLLSAKDGLKGGTGQICWQRGHGCWVLDLQDFVLTVLQWGLKGILSTDTLAFEESNVLESAFANIFEFSVDVGNELVFVFGGECGPGLFALGNGVESSLHAVNFHRARDIGIQLWLPHLSKQEKVSAKLLLMSVNPEERK